MPATVRCAETCTPPCLFLAHSDAPPEVQQALTQPLPQPPVPGAIITSPGFTRFFGCRCVEGGGPPRLTGRSSQEGGSAWSCPIRSADRTDGEGEATRWIVAVIVIALVLGLLLLGLGLYMLRCAAGACVRERVCVCVCVRVCVL